MTMCEYWVYEISRGKETLDNLTSALTSFSIVLKLRLWLSEIDVRCKQEQLTEYTEEVKWLQDSCILFRCIEFNQSDFDRPIMFVSLTTVHITVSSRSLLSVCLVEGFTASSCSLQDRLAPTTYFPPPFFPCIPLSLQPGPHISHILTVRGWGPSGRH